MIEKNLGKEEEEKGIPSHCNQTGYFALVGNL